MSELYSGLSNWPIDAFSWGPSRPTIPKASVIDDLGMRVNILHIAPLR